MAQNQDFTRDQYLEKPLPSSPDSERVILGAILLDNQLVSQAIEILRPEDFYSPLHRRIFKAMTALFERSERIDPILIGEELKKDGSIDSIGGIATITNLTFGLPHFSEIFTYAKVVKDKSIVRSLIKVCNQITSEALAEEEDAAEILDHAEQQIFALADEKTRQGFAHIKPIAETVIEKVQEFAKRETHALTGLATGFRDLDEKTSGLQRTDLIIVAARPSMGKTALCLTLAQNAAIQENAVVAVFSLEMSKEQLVMRMLSSEAKVDAHRFRSGYLTRDEWARLAEAIGTLSEASIFIDDTPGISVLEMRAKLRRLAAENKKLDLVVVDYLQLMSGGKRTESRQQEVSQISRELKALAKEMHVPVVALSQLSRAPEARNPPRPMMSDLRESGCLAADSLVVLAESGDRVRIADLEGRAGFSIWALNTATWKLERAVVTNAFKTGNKQVFEVTTRLGRTIRATANHEFLGFDGWARLDALKIGDRIAVPRNIRPGDQSDITQEEAALLGHMIGDGCALPRHSIQYTTKEIEIAEIVSNLAESVFGSAIEPIIKRERNWYQVYLRSTRRHTHGVRNAVSEWLDGLGIWGLRSFEKRIPDAMFRQAEPVVSTFIRHLWTTDGCIWQNRTEGQSAIYFSSSSERLARDLQSLLIRLGINARVRVVGQKNKGRQQYHVVVSGNPNVQLFSERIGAVGTRRSNTLQSIRNRISTTRSNPNRDSIPSSVWRQLVVPEAASNGISARELQAGIGTKYCGSTIYRSGVGRERLLRIASFLDSESIRNLSDSDVLWDEIASIESSGTSDVYDLTVDGHHNFVAQDIVVHNSIEQDADVVAFIYREDYYKPSEENAGIAELLIAKQRNGPTGTVRLAFLKEFTRFENYYGDYNSND